MKLHKIFFIICSVLIIPIISEAETWQRVLPAYVDNIYLAGAYSGSVNYSKPFWVDIDGDNDYDLFIGGEHGGMHFYRNIGTPSSPSWSFVTEFYKNIDVENRSSEAFVDIDADGDYDVFAGEWVGIIDFYENTGTPDNHRWTIVSENYGSIDVGDNSAPTFADIDNDGDEDLFIGERWGGLNLYLQIIGDIIPPKPPFITRVEKTGSNVKLTWNRVTQDTLNNPENIHHYVVYRSTTPDFVPALSDSIGYVNSPDTIYTNLNAHNAPQSYYYLIKAVDNSGNKSYPSNMGFKFNKFLNHNPATTDMNWVSLPFLNTYTTAASISSELSPNGTSLNQITNLRNDQYYEDWFYVEGIGWMGNDFVINKGSGYEFVVLKDTTPVITGAHDPNFRVPLIENPAATDMNWVSVPYNAVYGVVSDITTEFSPAGSPLLQVTRLRSDQYYEDWFYVEGLGWMGEDFAIERGCAYEYVVNVDTSWKPTVYSNRGRVLAKRNKNPEEMKVNHYREPVWSAGEIAKSLSTSDVMFEIGLVKEENRVRQPHLVVALFDINGLQMSSEDITFTAYCMSHPEKALFEGSAGCGYKIKKNNAVVWAQFGNLPFIWQPEEEAVIICEAKSGDVNYFGVKRFKLNPKENPQYVGEIKLAPVPEIEVIKDGSFYSLYWTTLEDIPIIGYSVYQYKERLNSTIISEEHYITSVAGKYLLKPVFWGGYETILTSEKIMIDAGTGIEPKVFLLESAMPNPFKDYVQIRYALPVTSQVSLNLYDVTGRQIKDLVNRVEQAGYYAVKWDGRDDAGREVSSGVYLVCFKAGEFKAYKKLLLVK